jgi:PAS domain S-box-containing protein
MFFTALEKRSDAVNREYARTYGYDPSELLGHEFTLTVPRKQRDAAAQFHDDFVLRGSGEVGGEWRAVRSDGSIRTILVTAGPSGIGPGGDHGGLDAAIHNERCTANFLRPGRRGFTRHRNNESCGGTINNGNVDPCREVSSWHQP